MTKKHLLTLIRPLGAAVVALQLVIAAPAQAAWHDRSDELPGQEDDGDIVLYGVLGGAAVLGIVIAAVLLSSDDGASSGAASAKPAQANATKADLDFFVDVQPAGADAAADLAMELGVNGRF